MLSPSFVQSLQILPPRAVIYQKLHTFVAEASRAIPSVTNYKCNMKVVLNQKFSQLKCTRLDSMIVRTDMELKLEIPTRHCPGQICSMARYELISNCKGAIHKVCTYTPKNGHFNPPPPSAHCYYKFAFTILFGLTTTTPSP